MSHSEDLEIKNLFESDTPLSQERLDSFGKKNREILDDPSFKADVLKDQIIHAIMEALDSDGITQSELAKRCGKTRQALNKQLDVNKPGNFSIETIVELMHHLGRDVELHFPKNCNQSQVVSNLDTTNNHILFTSKRSGKVKVKRNQDNNPIKESYTSVHKKVVSR